VTERDDPRTLLALPVGRVHPLRGGPAGAGATRLVVVRCAGGGQATRQAAARVTRAQWCHPSGPKATSPPQLRQVSTSNGRWIGAPRPRPERFASSGPEPAVRGRVSLGPRLPDGREVELPFEAQAEAMPRVPPCAGWRPVDRPRRGHPHGAALLWGAPGRHGGPGPGLASRAPAASPSQVLAVADALWARAVARGDGGGRDAGRTPPRR